LGDDAAPYLGTGAWLAPRNILLSRMLYQISWLKVKPFGHM